MGVTNLWTILGPVKKHTMLTDLKGQVLAVDLSIWVCENQSVKQMHGVVMKPHLRNLLFRVSNLAQLGVKLVFVIEGEAPELKWEEMWKRQQARGLVKHGTTYKGCKQKRSQFAACLRECCELLDLLGIPHITGRGEAEAMCAALNAAGLVDACITDDGDVFLYGARTVYRNFTMNSKDPHVESYNMCDIEQDLNINRQSLVGLSLLLGCDYLPGGVAGVGVANAVKLLKSLSGHDVIQRFREWRRMNADLCIDKIEMTVREKALRQSDFPQQQVVDEFLNLKEKLPTKPFQWKKANISVAQEFGSRKLDWPIEYTREKVLPLVTLWSMLDRKQNGPSSKHVQPHRIVKSRVRHGVACYEVEWIKDEWDKTSTCDYYTTIEQELLYRDCYPHLVTDYNNIIENNIKKKKVSKKKSKKECDVNDLATQMESVSLDKPLLPIVKKIDKHVHNLGIGIDSAATVHIPNDLIPTAKKENSKLYQIKSVSSENIYSLDMATENPVDEDEEDVFVPLSVRVKQRLAKNKDKAADVETMFEINHLSVIPSISLSRNQSEEHSVDISKSLLKYPDLSVKANTSKACDIFNRDILTHNEEMPGKGDLQNNKLTDIPIKAYSTLFFQNDEKVNSDMEKFMQLKFDVQDTKISQVVKKKKSKEKKSIKSVKKKLLLLEDSILESSPKPEVHASASYVNIYIDSNNVENNTGIGIQNDIFSNLKETPDQNLQTKMFHSESPENIGTAQIDISPNSSPNHVPTDELIDNILMQSFRNLSFTNTKHPEIKDECNMDKYGRERSTLSTKLLYSAVKNGRRKMSTPCHNSRFSSIGTPQSVGRNKPCDYTFGNFNIQTSLLNSLLYVSKTESPVNNTCTEPSVSNLKPVTTSPVVNDQGTTSDFRNSNVEPSGERFVDVHQSPALLQNNSSSQVLGIHHDSVNSPVNNVSNHLTFSPMSPIIPVIDNLDSDKVKILLSFTPCDQQGENSLNHVISPTLITLNSVTNSQGHMTSNHLIPPTLKTMNDVRNSETTYNCPTPLSLKERLKLRLKGSNTKILQELSHL